MLKNNQLKGTLDIDTDINNQLELLDLQTNIIEELDPQMDLAKGKLTQTTITLVSY